MLSRSQHNTFLSLKQTTLFRFFTLCYELYIKLSTINFSVFQHDAGAVICDSELTSQLKSAAYSALKRMEGDIQEEVPTLMSGAGHDAMAMSRLTKVSHPFLLFSLYKFTSSHAVFFSRPKNVTILVVTLVFSPSYVEYDNE